MTDYGYLKLQLENLELKSKLEIISKVFSGELEHNETEKLKNDLDFQKSIVEMCFDADRTNKLLLKIINFFPGYVFAKDLNNKYIFANKLFCSYIGTDFKTIQGKTDAQLYDNFPADFSTEIFELSETISKDSSPVLKSMEGIGKFFSVIQTDISDRKGEKSGVLTLAQDVTKIIMIEKELLGVNNNLKRIIEKKVDLLDKSGSLFSALFKKSIDCVIFTDLKGNIIEVNKSTVDMLGYPKSKLLQMNLTEITWYRAGINRTGVMTELVEKKELIYETEFVNSLGQLIPFEVSGLVIKQDSAETIMIIARDISERNKQQKNILKTIIKTEENERKRLAMEIHDGLGALLSGAKMYIDLLVDENISPEKTRELLLETKNLLDEAAVTTKEVANNIKPHVLTNFGLVKALVLLTNRINTTGKLDIDLDVLNYNLKLDDFFELAIYRVISELINNTIKHAEASKIRIKIINTGTIVNISYIDNGKGFDVEKALQNQTDDRNGLKNIINRVETIKGASKITSEIKQGTFVKITIDTRDYLSAGEKNEYFN